MNIPTYIYIYVQLYIYVYMYIYQEPGEPAASEHRSRFLDLPCLEIICLFHVLVFKVQGSGFTGFKG